MKRDGENKKPDLGNYNVYSPRLKEIVNSTPDREIHLYGRLKAAIQAGEITVNTAYLPANDRVFTIMFHAKHLSETVIRALVGEKVSIMDPLAEHRNDLLKAIESSIRVDIYLKDILGNVYTLDMHRYYFKKRNRSRLVYYAAKELAAQEVKDCRYERLNQVSITFIFEENTTPGMPPVSKLRFADVNTGEVYTDLLTLYEINVNRITGEAVQGLPDELVILKAFLSIKTHGDLCGFVNAYDTGFSRSLVLCYMDAILDDGLLLKVEGSEKFKMKISDEVLMEEREEGRAEGLEEGRAEGLEEGRAEGLEEGLEKGEVNVKKIVAFLKNGIAPEAIAEAVDVPLEKVYEWKELLFAGPDSVA